MTERLGGSTTLRLSNTALQETSHSSNVLTSLLPLAEHRDFVEIIPLVGAPTTTGRTQAVPAAHPAANSSPNDDPPAVPLAPLAPPEPEFLPPIISQDHIVGILSITYSYIVKR